MIDVADVLDGVAGLSEKDLADLKAHAAQLRERYPVLAQGIRAAWWAQFKGTTIPHELQNLKRSELEDELHGVYFLLAEEVDRQVRKLRGS